MRTVHCSKCNLDLPIEAFRAGIITPGTKRNTCKKCRSIMAREWALANPDRASKSCRSYQKKHSVKRKAWRDANKEKLHAASVKWRNDNPEKWKEICKRTREKNLEKKLIANREREILEGRALPKWANREAIRSIYMESRRLTKETGIPHHVDHVIPLKGKNVSGLHVESNLQILLARENLSKLNKFVEV